MQTSVASKAPFAVLHSVTRENLLALANFYDEQAQALSFYFSLPSSPDNSHRQETVMIKKLVRDIANTGKIQEGTAKDLDAIVAIGDEVRHVPSRFTAVFTCHDRDLGQTFELPASAALSSLQMGHRFHIVPLLQALQLCIPYSVVIVERGRARAFVIRGSEVQEIHGQFKDEDLGLRSDDSRVGWSHHIEGNCQERAKSYLKKLSADVQHLKEKYECSRWVIGCREDVWGELVPHLAEAQRAALMGCFHPASFDVSPADILQAARPLLEESLQKDYKKVLQAIDGSSAHSARGLDEVLGCLQEGRVQKLVVGKPLGEMIYECRRCGRLWTGDGNCLLCGSNNVCPSPAEEALIRKALVTEAEIVFPALGASYGCEGVAAQLRY
jgi:rubrerythrin